MRRIIRNILEKDSLWLEVVGEASDGVIALEKVAELSPDIILLDIEMPNMDAYSEPAGQNSSRAQKSLSFLSGTDRS